ncbi:hypothetical protein [Limosilactobacillus sp.]|uniref:type IV pilus modification PilV family protein n=1 Tax=Limosilactobacillus sp. TaxID=2773925 RepID=UPI0035A042E9
MKKQIIKGFVLADSLVALTIVTLGIGMLLAGQQQLSIQQRHHQARLIAARLAKEATDQLIATRGEKTVSIQRGPYRALANSRGVVVQNGHKTVVSLQQ